MHSNLMQKTIVILGAGIGGIVAARELRRHLGNKHRIVLIDRSAVHSFPPSYLWVMMGWRRASAICKPLSLLEKHGIEFHHAAITSIATSPIVVETERDVFPCDYLVIALGAELAWDSIPGLTSNANTFYTLEGAERLAAKLSSFPGGRISIAIGGMPYKCPPAPYEAALLIDSYLARKGIAEYSITLHTPEPAPLSVAGPVAGSAVRQLLEQRRIELTTKANIISVDQHERRLTFHDGTSEQSDLLIIVPPHRAPAVIRAHGLCDDNGWIPVDEQTLRTRHHRVYAIGDVTTIATANGFAIPKAGVFALAQAEVIAHNIAREIHQSGTAKEFTGTGFCFLETGNGRAGYVSGNFFAKPSPSVTLHEPSVGYHWAKVVFEKYWLWRWF